MRREGVTVRAAMPDDVPALLALWTELREATGRNDSVPPAAEERLAEALADDGTRLVIAAVAGEPAGMACLHAHALSPLCDVRVVQLDYLVVGSRHRRRGVGRALVAAATAYADEVGADHLTVSAPPGQREANRFLARLGFGPLIVHRAATTTAVRRRLAAPDSRRSVLDELVRRRNRTRVRPAPYPR